jgi:malonyl-CoA O-methyltransferase
VLDQRRIRRAFERVAPGFNAADFIHGDIRDRLLDRLQVVRLKPEWILDLGAGTGLGAASLGARYHDSRIIAVDFAEGMLAGFERDEFANRSITAICADAASLPIKDHSIDLIFSNLMLHHCSEPQLVLTEARRTLGFPGLLIFTILGQDSLIELREAWLAADGFSHVSAFMDMHHVGDALVQAGFVEPVVDVETLTITYENLPRLLADLRGVGSINATEHRNPGLTGRQAWQRMSEAYERRRDKNGRLPVTLEIIYGLAWSGEPGKGVRMSAGEIEFPLADLGRHSKNTP